MTDWKVAGSGAGVLSPLTEALAPGDMFSVVNVSDTITAPADAGGSTQSVTLAGLALGITGLVNVIAAEDADPAGAAEARGAFQAAVNGIAAFGGTVLAPAGTYKLTPFSVTVPAVTVPSNVTIAGVGRGATTLVKGGNGILLDYSGPGPAALVPSINENQGLRDLTLDGGGFTGLLVRLYYVQGYSELGACLQNNADVSVDMVEFWDSRMVNGLYLYGGSASASAISGGQAAFHLIRNSAAPATTLASGISGTVTALPVAALPAAMPAGVVQVWNAAGQVQDFTTTGAASGATSIPVTSTTVAHAFVTADTVNGFGWSGDNTNADTFTGCHWEGNLSGAIWITPGVDNTDTPNEIFILASKVEEDAIGYDCPIVQVDPGCTGIRIRDMYLFAGGFNAGFSTPVPGIYFHPDSGSLSGVDMGNGSDATVSTGIDMGSDAFALTATDVFQFWTTSPTVAGFNGSASNSVYLVNFQVNGTVTTPLAGSFTLISDSFGNWQLGTGSGSGVGSIGATTAYGLLSVNAGTDTSGTAAASAPTFTSGTAKQFSTTQDVMLYCVITGTVTFALAMGATSSASSAIVTSHSASAGQSFSVRVPKGWFVKVTGASNVSLVMVTC